MTELCEVCGLEPQVPGGCWRDFGGFDVSEDTVCYRLGFERLKAENASLHGMATALGKQCAELERDRDYNAELRDAAEQRNTELEGALRKCKNLTRFQQHDLGTVPWVGEEVGRIVDAALHDEERSAPGRAEPPAGPSDSLSKTAAQGEEK